MYLIRVASRTIVEVQARAALQRGGAIDADIRRRQGFSFLRECCIREQ